MVVGLTTKMKKIIIMSLLMQTLLGCAQTIYPLNLPNATSCSYIKDMDAAPQRVPMKVSANIS